MSKKRQSAEDQRKRIETGRCPIHGTGMGQVGLLAEQFSIVQCTRSGCSIMAIEGRRQGPEGHPYEFLTLVTDKQLAKLREFFGGMQDEFMRQAWRAISTELQNVAASSEAQLPVAG